MAGYVAGLMLVNALIFAVRTNKARSDASCVALWFLAVTNFLCAMIVGGGHVYA